MKSFEKRMLVEYLDKHIENIDFDSNNIDDLISSIISDLKIKKTKFKLSEKGDLLLNTSSECHDFRVQLHCEITKLKKKSKNKITPFEEKLNVIKKIYALEEQDYLILIFYVLKELSTTIHLLSECLSRDFLSFYFNCRYGYRSRDFERNLQNYGILFYEGCEYQLNKNILDILTSSSFNNEDKIITKLLGKKIKSKLKPKDFTHLSQELNKATKLLESATKSKQKGVNIFLYGDVGCGKTEFAKLIANSAKQICTK